MAPRSKFTRQELINASFKIVRERGSDALTAKAIADELHISTRPIFTCFGSMDEVRREVRAAAEALYDRYTAEGFRQRVPFFGFGMQYIRFAKEAPELYRLLFLSKAVDGENGAIEAMRHSQAIVRPSLEKIYRIRPEEADRYFRDLWLVVHSLATLIVTGGCPYSESEIGQILTGFSVSICKSIKEIPGFASGDFDRDAVFAQLVQEDRTTQTKEEENP